MTKRFMADLSPDAWNRDRSRYRLWERTPMPTLSFTDRRILEDALCETGPFLTARGRHALVRDALGGYPLAGQIDKALHWVVWDDAPKPFAVGLIRLLEGHEAAPGVPALGVIAEAIESMAGGEHKA